MCRRKSRLSTPNSIIAASILISIDTAYYTLESRKQNAPYPLLYISSISLPLNNGARRLNYTYTQNRPGGVAPAYGASVCQITYVLFRTSVFAIYTTYTYPLASSTTHRERELQSVKYRPLYNAESWTSSPWLATVTIVSALLATIAQYTFFFPGKRRRTHLSDSVSRRFLGSVSFCVTVWVSSASVIL